MRYGMFVATVMAFSTPAWAQGNAPFLPINPSDTAPASSLDNMPSKSISNGIVSAKIFLPVPFGFYRSTRFDHAGMITHVTYKGQDFGRYWFAAISPDVKNFTYDNDGLVAHPSDVAAGPVEEFGENGFENAQPGGRFLKIGVGILERDTNVYDRFHTYPILNEGKRTTRVSKSSITFTQNISGDPSGYGYFYEKRIELVPGKAEMRIEDHLKNTGKKDIDTTVYNHNFLTLGNGNDGVELSAPFAIKSLRDMPVDVVRFEGGHMIYLRGLTGEEQVASDLGGYGKSVSDNDFRIMDTKSGYGVRVRADLPVTRRLWWSVPSTLGLEPYMAISLKPGQEKHWTYILDYYAPGEHP